MSEYDHNHDRDRHTEQGEGIIRKYERYMYGGRVARDRIEENSPNATISELDEDDLQILNLVDSDEKQELTPEDEREINQVFQAGVPAAIVGTYGTTLGKKVIWRTFGAVIASKYGAVAAQALGLSAADGLLPVGEAVAAGLLAVTAWQIYRNWDELWRDAEQILVQQEPEPQVYTTPTDPEVETQRHTGHAPPGRLRTRTPELDMSQQVETPRHTGHETEKPVAEDFVMESVSLPYPKLAPGDTPLGDKLRSLGFKPNDIKRIYDSLEKTGGGQAVADWIKSGQFDNIDGYDELVKFAKNRKELASVYQSLEAGEILLREGNRIKFEQTKDEVPKYDIDIAILGTGTTYVRVIQLKYLESLSKIIKNANRAASQLVNVEGNPERLVQIRIDKGSYQEFADSGKENLFLQQVKGKYPDTKMKIEFSDGTIKNY